MRVIHTDLDGLVRIDQLEQELDAANDRADRAEAKLHELVEAVEYHTENQSLDAMPRLKAAFKAAKGE